MSLVRFVDSELKRWTYSYWCWWDGRSLTRASGPGVAAYFERNPGVCPAAMRCAVRNRRLPAGNDAPSPQIVQSMEGI